MVDRHQQSQASRGQEDEVGGGAAEGEDYAEFTEEEESEETPGSLTGPGEGGVFVQQADVGEPPQVVQDEQQQGAVGQQLGRERSGKLSNINCSYLGLGGQTNELRDEELEGEMYDGVGMEGHGNAGVKLHPAGAL